MSVPVPALVRSPDMFDRFVFEDKNVFTTNDWTPTLTAVHAAETFEEQRFALTAALINVGARYFGLSDANKGRFRPYIPHIGVEARFSIQDGEASMAYIRMADVAIGYQTPNAAQPNIAYAVVDNIGGGTYHNVIHDPAEEIGTMEKDMGLATVRALSGFLSDRYPGFELERKLVESGVPL